jgi:hypothetical protein
MRLKPCPPSRVKRYRALLKPRCNEGEGCPACWDKWRTVRRRGLLVMAP